MSVLSLLLRIFLFPLKLSCESSFPKALSASRERELLSRTAEGDLSARNELIEHNLRLVVHIIKKYYAGSDEREDLISIGVIGLIKAINSFDGRKNTRLATYAARCVENEIFMYFRGLKRRKNEVSLSDPIESDDEGGNLELMDILSYDEDMLENVLQGDRVRLVRRAISEALDPREREIITLRYALRGGAALPQREVASRLGISRSYVSRIEKSALERIRGYISGKNFDIPLDKRPSGE